MVIARRAARGERVAEPEAVLDRNGVGDVGKRRGALVGRHHQIGVVLVPDDHVAGVHDLPLDQIVGEIEQRGDEGAVGGNAGLADFIARAVERQVLGIEPALGAHRHDHGILHLLGLHKPQHLGAEIVAPIRPAQSAPRHRPETTMDAFHAWPGHEDLAEGFRRGQLFQLLAGDLETDRALRAAIGQGLAEIGAHDRHDQVGNAADDAVIVKRGDLPEPGLDLLAQDTAAGSAVIHLVFIMGVEACAEQLEQLARQIGMFAQGADLGCAGRVTPGLLAEGGQAAQEGRLAPGCADRKDQLVEAVILRFAHPGRDEGLLEPVGQQVHRHRRRIRYAHLDMVDPVGLRRIGREPQRRAHRKTGLRGHEQAHMLEHRHTVRQRDRPVADIDLGLQGFLIVALELEGAHAHRRGGAQFGQLAHIEQGLLGREGLAIGCVEGTAEDRRTGRGLCVQFGFLERGTVGLVPGARHFGDLRFQRSDIGQCRGPVEADMIGHAGECGGIKARLEIGHRTAERGLQERGDLLAQLGIIGLARDIDDGGDEAVELVAAQENARARPANQVQRAAQHGRQRLGGGLEQLIARPGLDQVHQRLGIVPARTRTGIGDDLGRPLAHQRNGARGLVIGLGREQAEEARLTVHAAAFVIMLDADIVGGHAPVHPADHGRLRDDDRFAPADKGADLGGENGRLAGAVEHIELLVAQQAEIGALHHVGLVGDEIAILIAREQIGALAEKDEMIAGEPVQEGRRFRAQVLVQMGLPAEAFDLLAHGRAHGAIVRHRQGHIGQGEPDLGLQLVCFTVRQARQENLDRGNPPAFLHRDDRVEQGQDFEAKT